MKSKQEKSSQSPTKKTKKTTHVKKTVKKKKATSTNVQKVNSSRLKASDVFVPLVTNQVKLAEEQHKAYQQHVQRQQQLLKAKKAAHLKALERNSKEEMTQDTTKVTPATVQKKSVFKQQKIQF